MDRTLLRSLKSNTNCSRISGVIRARTISERLLMNKKPKPRRARAKIPAGVGGGTVLRGAKSRLCLQPHRGD